MTEPLIPVRQHHLHHSISRRKRNLAFTSIHKTSSTPGSQAEAHVMGTSRQLLRRQEVSVITKMRILETAEQLDNTGGRMHHHYKEKP